MQRKHVMGVALVVALVISSVGLLNVGAQDDETAWLGVGVEDSSAGVVIVEVHPNGPADDAGLERGDAIETVGRTRITSVAQLVDVIQSFDPGDEILIVVVRDGEELSLEVVLGERPDELDEPSIYPQMHGEMVLFGMALTMTDDGIVVESIDEGSPLADVGLAPGDRIVAINGEPVEELLPRIMMQSMWHEAVTFTVLRDGEELEFTLNFAELLGEFDYPPFEVDVVEIPRPMQLGVQFRTLNAEIAAEEELPVEDGALVIEVLEDTPAAAAGLEAGDIITAVDGDLVDAEHTLTDRLFAYEDGDVVVLTVLRDGEELSVEVTLGPNPHAGRVSVVRPFLPGMSGERPFFFGPGIFYFIPMPGGEGFELHPGMVIPFQEDGRGFGLWLGPGEGRGIWGRDGERGMFFEVPEGVFEIHPFTGEWMEMMPFHEEGGFRFRFHFGPSDEVTPDEGDAMEDGAIETVPEASNTNA